MVEYGFRLSRLVRTLSSEIHLIWQGERRIGQADVHFAGDTIHATIVLEADLTIAEEEQLIAQIDDEIVLSYLPRFERDDFVAHVFRAEQINRYTDASGVIEDVEEMPQDPGDFLDDDDDSSGGYDDDVDPFRDE
jgi:hypothetical protein